MTRAEVAERVIAIIAFRSEEPRATIRPATRLASLNAEPVALAADLEGVFGIAIPEADVAAWQKVEDVVTWVADRWPTFHTKTAPVASLAAERSEYIEAGEPYYTVSARSVTAPLVVEFAAFAMAVAIEHGELPKTDLAKVAAALDCAQEMRRWRGGSLGRSSQFHATEAIVLRLTGAERRPS